MTDITKLADEWLEEGWLDSVVNKDPTEVFEKCAKQLEAALPVWTRIIADDPDTLPKKRGYILGIDNTEEEKFPEPFWWEDGSAFPSFITHWRPLCGIDCPPDSGEG